MKVILLIMSLVTETGDRLPPQITPMESMSECMARLEEMNAKFLAINETFTFAGSCVIKSSKANPA